MQEWGESFCVSGTRTEGSPSLTGVNRKQQEVVRAGFGFRPEIDYDPCFSRTVCAFFAVDFWLR